MNITIGGKNREVTDEQMKQIEKLLNKELRTPDNILFCAGTGRETVYGLFFNENQQILGFSYGTKQWTVTGVSDQILRTNRKLVPIDREDLLPGDVAFRSDKYEEEFDRLLDYCIILDAKKVVSLTESSSEPIFIYIAEEDESWWKVV